ncbi:hypothetical protein AK812_SmicGene32570 [Symbiodinium microadriaticum]|uniref:Dynamin N-terminal domain-containing protein n=1 Tax=Symbiodinium microadriaticum TaxID=2951 RepID=A0A1Q9CTR8_SYMMI|nr:hypothetical protein AK812_SmicGene32570 [Symbiodinium microadriaticum]
MHRFAQVEHYCIYDVSLRRGAEIGVSEDAQINCCAPVHWDSRGAKPDFAILIGHLGCTKPIRGYARLPGGNTLHDLLDVNSRLKGQHIVRILTLVVFGVQSSGKTSFIEALLKFPVGYTHRSTGTRCPVRYILRNSPTATWTVGGMVCDTREDVRKCVSDYMKQLATSNKFENNPLKVEIFEPARIDMDITDLPGLKDKNEPDAEEIRAITVSYLTSDDVFPVVLCKAEKSHETQLDLDSLSELGLDPKKALIVANYFNKQIGDFSAVSELNTYCSGYQAKYPQIRFVMLQPQDGINKDGMKFQELSDYYENLAEKEKQALDQHVERMEKDVRLKPSVTKNIGVTSAFDFMHAQLHRWMQDNRDRIRDALQERRRQLQDEMAALEAALGEGEDVRKLWRYYILDFQRVLSAIYEAKQIHVRDVHDTSRYGKGMDWAFTTDDLEVGRTFQEVEQLIPDSDRKAWTMDYEALEEQLQGTHTGRLLGWRLAAHAGFARLLHVVGYMIMRHGLRPLSLSEMYSKNAHDNSGLTHTFNKHAVLKQLVVEKMFDLQNLMQAALSHVEALYKAPVEAVQEIVQRSHPSVMSHHAFRARLSEVFGQLLVDKLEAAKAVLHHLIKQKTSFFGVDLTSRLIALVALAPLRQDVFQQKPSVFENEIQMENDEKGSGESASTTASSNSQKNLHQTRDVSHRHSTSTSDSAVPARYHPHREAVLSVKRALHKTRSQFCTIDFIEGGLQDLSPEEYRTLDEKEFNNDAEQYFYVLKGLLVLEVESTLHTHLFGFLQSDLATSVGKQMLEVVDGLTDDEVKELKGDDDDSRHRLEELKPQCEVLEEALKKLGGTGADAPSAGTKSNPYTSANVPTAVINGELTCNGMDLSKIAGYPAWNRTFWSHARAEVAQAFDIQESQVDVCKCGNHSIGFCLKLRGDNLPMKKQKMEEKIAKHSRGVIMSRCADTYVRALGLDENMKTVVGTVHAATVSGSSHKVQEERKKAKDEAKEQTEQAQKAEGTAQRRPFQFVVKWIGARNFHLHHARAVNRRGHNRFLLGCFSTAMACFDELPNGLIVFQAVALAETRVQLYQAVQQDAAEDTKRKREFWDHLSEQTLEVDSPYSLIIVGDLNARLDKDIDPTGVHVGSETWGKRLSIDSPERDNAVYLLEFLQSFDMKLPQTFMSSSPARKVTYKETSCTDHLLRDPEVMNWTTLDYVISNLSPSFEITDLGSIPGNELADQMARAGKSFQEVYQEIRQVGKATGPDGIPAELIKRAPYVVQTFILSHYNKCLRTGSIPDAWLLSEVVMLVKDARKDTLSLDNYRPISLTDVFYKLYVNRRLSQFTYCVG